MAGRSAKGKERATAIDIDQDDDEEQLMGTMLATSHFTVQKLKILEENLEVRRPARKWCTFRTFKLSISYT